VLQMLQQDLSQTKGELDVRVQQLQKVVKALNNLKERDSATTAALETQTSLVAELQDQLSHAHVECKRWKQSVDMLQQEHSTLTSTVASLTDQLEDLKEESSARNEVVSMATRSADSVRVLNAALDAAKTEIGDLKDQLASARLESRRDCISLQRIADDRQSLIQALQADLNAATTALSSAAQPAAKRWSEQEIPRGDLLDMSAQSGRSLARRRGVAVGSTGGKPIFAVKMDTAASESENADASRARLMNESLSRRIVVLEERIRHLEAEQVCVALNLALPGCNVDSAAVAGLVIGHQ
jgi:chromosome segregation ATPase